MNVSFCDSLTLQDRQNGIKEVLTLQDRQNGIEEVVEEGDSEVE